MTLGGSVLESPNACEVLSCGDLSLVKQTLPHCSCPDRISCLSVSSAVVSGCTPLVLLVLIAAAAAAAAWSQPFAGITVLTGEHSFISVA